MRCRGSHARDSTANWPPEDTLRGAEGGGGAGRGRGQIDLTWVPTQVNCKNEAKYKQSFMKLMKHVKM